MNNELNFIAKWRGGSHLYNLSTPESDIDERGIFINTDVGKILGLERFDQQVKNNKKKDIHFYEIRHFFELLKGSNTCAIEPLWSDEKHLLLTDSHFNEIRSHRESLIDTKGLFRVLKGYIQSQKFLVFDDKRKAEPGSTRANQIIRYGYTPKPAVHIFRLAFSGISYFQTGIYRVQIPGKYNDFCMKIKTQPESFKAEEIRKEIEGVEVDLNSAFNSTYVKHTFNNSLVNSMLRDLYLPYIKNEKY